MKSITYHSLELFRQIVSALLPVEGNDFKYREKLLTVIAEMMAETENDIDTSTEADDVK